MRNCWAVRLLEAVVAVRVCRLDAAHPADRLQRTGGHAQGVAAQRIAILALHRHGRAREGRGHGLVNRGEGRLPVVLFTAGGIATPADAAMMMQLGAEGVFVGSGIFKSGDPAKRAAAIVKATTFYDDPSVIAEVSRGLGEAMVGINVDDLPVDHRLAERGW